LRHLGLELPDIRLDRLQRILVILLGGNLQQFPGVLQGLAHLAERQYHLFQARALTPELLGALGVVPDFGVFKLAADFGQAFLAGIEVKDTP
jgi:hypothetical protein